MARKTHRRKSKRSSKRVTHRRRTHRRRGGACGPCAAGLMRGGRGYTTSASQELYQMTGRTPGLSSGGNRNRKNNAPPFVQNLRNKLANNKTINNALKESYNMRMENANMQ
jgi:hypothetical protein